MQKCSRYIRGLSCFGVKVVENLGPDIKFTDSFCDVLKGEILKTLTGAMKDKHIAQDRISKQIADPYGLTHEYKTARSHNLTLWEALEFWDLIMLEERDLFKNEETVFSRYKEIK